MIASIRAFFLTILWVFLALPYGIDAPTRAFIDSSSLSNGAVVCEQTENGAEAAFTLHFTQDYRPILSPHAFDDFQAKVFKAPADAELNTDIAHSTYNGVQVVDDDETFPPVEASFTYEIENDPYLIRVGDQYTVIVHVTLAKNTAPDAYSFAISPNFAQECVFPDALIVK